MRVGWENERDWEQRLHEEAEGWHDEYAPCAVDFRPDFKQPFRDVPVKEPGRRGTYVELRQMKIEAGECPMPGCAGLLDEDFYCFGCGFVSTPGSERSLNKGFPTATEEAA